MDIENVIRFCKRYADKKIIRKATSGTEIANRVLGVCIGYLSTGIVLIKITNETDPVAIVKVGRGHLLADFPSYMPVITSKEYNKDTDRFWRFYWHDLEPFRPFTPIEPYPITCNSCKFPARRVGRSVLCSNRCKLSRKLVKSYYNE